ncbi:MAG: hypothetical protein RLZZ440_349, partial [Planctomycetota bacterium]
MNTPAAVEQEGGFPIDATPLSRREFGRAAWTAAAALAVGGRSWAATAEAEATAAP